MTLKLKIQELYMVLVKCFLENMCALSVSLHFLRALSLESESAHKKCKDRERARTKSVKTERERARIFISVCMCIFSGPYYISRIIWLIFVQDL